MATQALEQTTATPSIMDRTVCLQVALGRPGTRKKVDADRVEVNTDKDMLHVSKDIMDSPELKKVRMMDSVIRMFVKSRAVPANVLKGGVYVIALDAVDIVTKKLDELEGERKQLVEEFMDAYMRTDGIVAKAQERLKDLFDLSDYPSANEMRAAFTFQRGFFFFKTPDALKEISQGFFEREKKRNEQLWADGMEAAKVVLRSEMKALVDHMVERLTPNDDGKPKVFKNSLVENMAEFLDAFKYRNVVDDSQLQDLVDKARGLLKGKDAEGLRKAEESKAQVAAGFKELKATLDTMVIEKPSRRFDLDSTE